MFPGRVEPEAEQQSKILPRHLPSTRPHVPEFVKPCMTVVEARKQSIR